MNNINHDNVCIGQDLPSPPNYWEGSTLDNGVHSATPDESLCHSFRSNKINHKSCQCSKQVHSDASTSPKLVERETTRGQNKPNIGVGETGEAEMALNKKSDIPTSDNNDNEDNNNNITNEVIVTGRCKSFVDAFNGSVAYLRNVSFLMWGAPALRAVDSIGIVGGGNTKDSSSQRSSFLSTLIDVVPNLAPTKQLLFVPTASSTHARFSISGDDDHALHQEYANRRRGAALVDIGDDLWASYERGLRLLHQNVLMEQLVQDLESYCDERHQRRRGHSLISKEKIDEDSTGVGQTPQFDEGNGSRDSGSNKRQKRVT